MPTLFNFLDLRWYSIYGVRTGCRDKGIVKERVRDLINKTIYSPKIQRTFWKITVLYISSLWRKIFCQDISDSKH